MPEIEKGPGGTHGAEGARRYDIDPAGRFHVAVPFDVQERWEIEYGLRERAAENRVNLVAATRPRPGLGASLLIALEDFGMWRRDRKARFDGVISCPPVVHAEPKPGTTVLDLHPEEAVNRMVSKSTDLVDGRPWQLLDGVVG